MSAAKSTDLSKRDLLKEWEARFFGGIQILFDQCTNELAFRQTHMHGLSVGKASSHVPTEFECLGPDTFGLLFHLLDILDHFIGQ